MFMRIRLLFGVIALASTAASAGRTRVPTLPANPSFVSLIRLEGGETMTSQFGHIEVLFSYGSTPGRPNDRAVGFGPSEEDKRTRGPLAYIGIGDDLVMTIENVSFEERFQVASQQKMQRLVTVVLDLSAEERNKVVENFNDVIESGYPKPYHLLFENCATIVADLMRESSRLPRGLLTFLPTKLEKKFRPFALDREVLPSGRDLKRAVLERHAQALGAVFENSTQRAVFEKQLMSRQTEFRVLAYQRLLSDPRGRALAGELLEETESRDRAKTIRGVLARSTSFSSTQRTLRLARNEKFRSLKVEGDRVTLVYEKRVSGLPTARGASRATSSLLRERSWPLAELGLKSRSGEALDVDSFVVKSASRHQVHFWVATDLGLDRI